jgi:hypothetical protein
MTRDLQQIKQGLAQIRSALALLENFIAEYEARSVNTLPVEDVGFYRAPDEDLIGGAGLGELTSLNQTVHRAAEQIAPLETA